MRRIYLYDSIPELNAEIIQRSGGGTHNQTVRLQ